MPNYIVINTSVDPTYEDVLAMRDLDQLRYDTTSLQDAIVCQGVAEFSGAAEGNPGKWTIYEEVVDPHKKVVKWYHKLVDWLDRKAQCGY